MSIKLNNGKMTSEKKLRTDVNNLVAEIAILKIRLFDAGLVKTYHEMDKVTKAIGWEAAEMLTRGKKK